MDTKEILSQIEGRFDELTKGFAKEADYKGYVDALRTDYETAVKDFASKPDIDRLEGIMKEQGLLLSDLKTARVTTNDKMSIYDQVGTIIDQNPDGFNAFVNKQSPFRLNLKTVGTMTYSNITGDTAYLPMPAMVPGYNPYRWDPATFLTSANVRSTASARISYVDEGAGEGTPATTTEGNEKPQIDIDNVVAYSSAIKVAAHLKVSDEMLQDIPYLSGQINDNLTTRVRLAASNNIRTYITGLSGILTAVDATMAGLAGSDAQIWQLAVMAQQTIAKSNHSCTHLFLNPTDYARLIALKGINNAPIIVGATSANVAGITIVPSNSMTVDKYIACDISKLNVWEYKPLSVEMGWVNDDFTKNLRTFVGETRLHYYIQANDKTAFLYGDVTDDLTTITA